MYTNIVRTSNFGLGITCTELLHFLGVNFVHSGVWLEQHTPPLVSARCPVRRTQPQPQVHNVGSLLQYFLGRLLSKNIQHFPPPRAKKMDPLTALGLASNIIQIISFTSNLISKGREIYKSADGTLITNLELEAITRNLQDLSGHLSFPRKRRKDLSDADKELQELCKGCTRVSAQLIEVIQGLAVRGDHRKFNSFRQALNSVWKEDTIEELSKRLERYRSQIDTMLLVSLREQIQHGETKASIPSGRTGQHVFGAMEETGRWQKELMEELRQNNWELQNQQDVANFSLKLSAYTNDKREHLVKARILQKLHFTNMGDRYERIEDAHRKTFDWIFLDEENVTENSSLSAIGSTLTHALQEGVLTQDLTSTTFGTESSRIVKGGSSTSNERGPQAMKFQSSSFVHWLKSQETIYWITGKPGSGKSTLMKYLYNDPRTLEHLSAWAGRKALVMAGFFFWNSGTVMQMSKIGLLQALLYHSINRSIDLIPILFPERWKSYELFGGDLHPWSWSELALAFRNLTSDKSQMFFFFIDGLDEFEGDHAELANFVLEHSSGSNVKMCIASRPWLVFEDAFQRRPSLRVEELTAGDIHYFVTEKLRGNDMFITLEMIEPSEARDLVTEVTGKASGVFLWVRLVVLSLLEGLRDGDRITDLQSRLLLLPSDLEDLFLKILDRLNPFYFEQASKLFQLIRAAGEPLSLLDLSFAEEGHEKAMAAEVNAMSLEEAKFRAETMRRRLNSRCKGLLEAPNLKSAGHLAQVQYLHRTVRDFLNRQDKWDYILSGTSDSFNPDISLCSGFLYQLKSITMAIDMRPHFRDLVKLCIHYSVKFEETDRALHVQILQEMDRVASNMFGSTHPSGQAWLVVVAIAQNPPLDLHFSRGWVALLPFPGEDVGDSFFDYAFKHTLYTYVSYELVAGRKPDSVIFGRSLLATAVDIWDARMIRILLDHGANPNLLAGDPMFTPWTGALRRIYAHTAERLSGAPVDPLDAEKQQNLDAEVILAFIEHNSDPRSTVNGQSSETIIKKAFQDWSPERTDEMLQKLVVLKKSYKGSSRGMKTFFGSLGHRSSKTK
jgi:hypothetical protein